MDMLNPLPDDLIVPEEWLALDQGSLGATVMLVGTTDTGKSTLARWLLESASRRGQTRPPFLSTEGRGINEWDHMILNQVPRSVSICDEQ